MKLAFVFNVFGAMIINNINKNIRLSVDNDSVVFCEECGNRFRAKNVARAKYCDKCAIEVNKEKTRNNMRNTRSNDV